MTNIICGEFHLTDTEWGQLEVEFENLVLYAGWQLLKKNTKNSHTDEIEDIAQELRWAVYQAGCYYKRQVYIESCFVVVKKYVKDPIMIKVVEELEDLWKNRTRHGANKIKYGGPQQDIMEQVIKSYVPESERPNRNQKLRIDSKFKTYCKAINWNKQKSLGKKITREKSWRSGLVSLSEFDYLSCA